MIRSFGILIVLLLNAFCEASIGCIDNNGNPVDWWVMLKYPKIKGTDNDDVTQGMAYSYADVNNRDLQSSASSIEDSNGPLFSTLQQIYDGDSSSVGWLMYNDEKPTGSTPDSYGHTKGVVGFDSQSGFWLVHSVPKFPGVSSISYPSGGLDYGQSFLCITLDFNSFETVGQQFLFNTPAVYGSNLPSSFASQLPNLAAVINQQWISGSVSNVANLTTVGGASFTSFAKNAAFNNDLYEYLVQLYYKTPMEVETWRNGPTADDIPSYCAPQYPYNSIIVDFISFGGSIGWKNTKDHSKWAISTNIYNDNTVCIGDVNKQYSQFKRGGGTVCIQDATLWKSFSSLISSAENC